MQITAVLVLFFALVCLAQDAPGACNFAEPVNYISFNNLVQNIKRAGFSSDKIKILNTFVSNLTLGFNSSQVSTLLSLFSFIDDRAQCLEIINDNILTLTVDGVVSIINSVTFSSEKLNALRAVVNLTNQVELKANSQKVINQFTFSSDKDEARKIIQNSAPRSCLFGPADLARFAFIIDVSGSMSTQFRDIDGQVYTRLQYVQKDLANVMETTLKDQQEFNVIQFSDSANAWKPGVVPVNRPNIQSAENYVRALRPGGGTYMLNALKLAFSDPRVLGVYFLSDGEPSDAPSNILSFLASVKKPCNTVAFKAGSVAQQFLYSMARVTNGTFRGIL